MQSILIQCDFVLFASAIYNGGFQCINNLSKSVFSNEELLLFMYICLNEQSLFLRFFILMKQLNRLYHFTYMILRWKKKWRASIINVHKIMFEWTSYLQHELFFEIFLLWWNKRDCITLWIWNTYDILKWKKMNVKICIFQHYY